MTLSSQHNPRLKSSARGIVKPNLKSYYRAKIIIINKQHDKGSKNRHVDQWSRRGSLEIYLIARFSTKTSSTLGKMYPR